MGKLTKKEERFCLEYVIDYNGTRAAIDAGYKESDAPNRAYRLLKKAEVSARVRELQHEMAERLALSEDFVVLEAMDTYRTCKELGDAKNALKALKLIGDHLGMFDKSKKGADGSDDKLEDVL